MKKGFAIFIQEDLDQKQQDKAKSFANKFISSTCLDPKFRYFGKTGGGYCSGLWRGRYGLEMPFQGELVFRRIAKNARKFGIVKPDTLVAHKGRPIIANKPSGWIECKEGEQIPSGCGCPNCKGQTRVRWKNNTPPKMKLYAQIGDIKG